MYEEAHRHQLQAVTPDFRPKVKVCIMSGPATSFRFENREIQQELWAAVERLGHGAKQYRSQMAPWDLSRRTGVL